MSDIHPTYNRLPFYEVRLHRTRRNPAGLAGMVLNLFATKDEAVSFADAFELESLEWIAIYEQVPVVPDDLRYAFVTLTSGGHIYMRGDI